MQVVKVYSECLKIPTGQESRVLYMQIHFIIFENISFFEIETHAYLIQFAKYKLSHIIIRYSK